MAENPYEPPQTPPEPRPSRKAIAGLSLLALLVAPSAAIAGAATCLGTGAAFRAQGTLSIVMGYVVCLLFVVGPLALQRRSDRGLNPRDLGRAVALILIWQLLAIPASLIVGFAGFALLYMVSMTRQDESGMIPFFLLVSFATYLISSVSAYLTWQSWFRQREGEDGPNSAR